jgi:hypothetical protein
MSELNPQPLPPQFQFRPRPFTDPIWMEFVLEQVDPAARKSLIAIRLNTVAAVYAAIAEGAKQAAEQITAHSVQGS